MKLSLSDPATMPRWQRRLEVGLIWTAVTATLLALGYALLLCHVPPDAFERALQRVRQRHPNGPPVSAETRPVVPLWRVGC